MSEEISPKEAIGFILEHATAMLKRDKFHIPILFIFGKRGYTLIVIEADLGDSKMKREAMTKAGMETAHLLPYCIAFISEAWMARKFPPEGKEVHDMEDKEECLAIAANSISTEEEASAFIPFSRVGEEIILGETEFAEHAEAYLLDNYWRGVQTEIQRHLEGKK